jgi:CheY-like chemotaxis protein
MAGMKKIFLIEDDADEREIFGMALAKLPVQTEFVFAQDGEEALTVVSSEHFSKPDYIFLDLNMPRVNGLAFLAALRSKNLYPDIPIYIYTTSSGGSDIDKCRTMGGELFTKPSTLGSLVTELQKRIA